MNGDWFLLSEIRCQPVQKLTIYGADWSQRHQSRPDILHFSFKAITRGGESKVHAHNLVQPTNIPLYQREAAPLSRLNYWPRHDVVFNAALLNLVSHLKQPVSPRKGDSVICK